MAAAPEVPAVPVAMSVYTAQAVKTTVDDGGRYHDETTLLPGLFLTEGEAAEVARSYMRNHANHYMFFHDDYDGPFIRVYVLKLTLGPASVPELIHVPVPQDMQDVRDAQEAASQQAAADAADEEANEQ